MHAKSKKLPNVTDVFVSSHMHMVLTHLVLQGSLALALLPGCKAPNLKSIRY